MPEHDPATGEAAPVPASVAAPIPTAGAGGAPSVEAPNVAAAVTVPAGSDGLAGPGQIPPMWDGVWHRPPPPPPGRVERFFIALWTRPAWLAPLALLGCMGLAFTYVLMNDPSDNQRDPLGPCAFKAVTGLDCPGCGGTRMVWYLLHGDLVQAGRHHLMAFLAAPVLAWAYLAWGMKRAFGLSLPTRRIPPVVWGGFLVATGLFAVLRNLPWEPFSWFFVR